MVFVTLVGSVQVLPVGMPLKMHCHTFQVTNWTSEFELF